MASAKVKMGECTMFGDKCVRNLEVELTKKEFKELQVRPLPENTASIKYDLLSKTATVLPPAEHRNVVRPETPIEIKKNDSESIGQFKTISKVSNPWLDNPLKTAVKLIMTIPGGQAACSGTMVGKHTVFTAGHCVYGNDMGGWVQSVTVIPAMDGYSWDRGQFVSPYGTYQATNLYASQAWIDSEDFRYDTAIIKLDKNIGEITGHMALEWSSNSYSGTINFAGYPGAEGYDGYYLYEEVGEMSHVMDDRYNICHYSKMIQGMSGGPAWLYYSASNNNLLTAANSFGTENGIYCHARYNSENDADRIDSESQTASAATGYWTCDLENYSTGDGCHCNCGTWDYDCESTSNGTYNCNDGNTCRYPGTCSCTPSCSGKECGNNGCGGSCGTCDDPNKSWCDDGTCKVPDCNEICDWRQCGDYKGCDCGNCSGDTPFCYDNICKPQDCESTCGWRECGTYDGCDCGTCSGAKPNCEENVCRSDSQECTGSCTNGDPGFCVGDHSMCTCYGGQYYNVDCQQGCEESGYFASAGCDKDPNSGNYVCYCANACSGYSGDDTCCSDGNPCNLANDGTCQCGGNCGWDNKDCNPTEDGDDTPVDGDDTPVDGDNTPVDGDETQVCSGSCQPIDTPFCTDNNQTICMCSNLQWQVNSCVAICRTQGMDFDICAYNAIEKTDYCACKPQAVDGDVAGDGDINTDGDIIVDGDESVLPDGDSGSGGENGSGGCNQTSLPSALLMLSIVAIISRRKIFGNK